MLLRQDKTSGALDICSRFLEMKGEGYAEENVITLTFG